jgi:N-acetylmuramoyl-L-alanine amidase
MIKDQTQFTTRYLIKCLIIFLLPLSLILTLALSSYYNPPDNAVTANLSPSDVKLSGSEEINKSAPMEVVVVIDAGHGGNDWGTYYGSVREKNVNLNMALKLGPLLQKEGIKIIYTREKDVFVELAERAEIANRADATLFISIHNNKMPGDSKYKGTETLYSTASNDRFSTMTDKRLAQIVQDTLVKNLGTRNNGIIYRPGLAVLRRTNMPAIITEIGYISNSSDREKLTSSSFRQKTAEALSGAVMKALNEMGARKIADGKWMVVGKKK